MRAYYLSILTLLFVCTGNQILAAERMSAYDDKTPPYPCAFTLGVVTGATTAPLAILSMQMIGIDPVTSYFSILAAASSPAFMLDIPYNVYCKENAAIAEANWDLLQGHYKNGSTIQQIPAVPDKAFKEALELLPLQSFAQGFLTGAALSPYILYLKMPYVMIHP